LNVRISPNTCRVAQMCANTLGKDKMAPSFEEDSHIAVFDLPEEDIDAFIGLVREFESKTSHGPFEIEKF